MDVVVPPRKRKLAAPAVVTSDPPVATVGRTLWDVISDLLARRDLRIVLIVLIIGIASAIAAGVATGKLEITLDDAVPTIKRASASHVACIWIAGTTTGNKCDVAVTVTSFVAIDPAGHEQTLPCYGPACTIPPSFSGPLLSPPGMQITRVVATQQ